MKNPGLLLGLCLYCSLPATGMASEPVTPLSYQQAEPLVHAVGQLVLREQLTLGLLQECSTEFRHLGESAEFARSNWQKTNTAILAKTKRIRSLVENSVQSTKSSFNAAKFTMDIEALVYSGVNKFRSGFVAKSRKERHYLCNRLILSISAGEWDLARQHPDEVTTILQFKEK